MKRSREKKIKKLKSDTKYIELSIILIPPKVEREISELP